MRRTFVAVVVLGLPLIHAYASGEETPSAQTVPSSEGIRTDAQADGDPNLQAPVHLAVVRLYRDWQADRRAYTTLSVPLEGSDVLFDAVAAQAGAPSDVSLDNAVVAVVPDDQQDAAVKTMMNGHIFADPYRAGHGFSLEAGEVREFLLLPCMFVDPLHEPLANMEVEIWVGDSNYDLSSGRKIWIANVRLDANGRMPSPRTATRTRLRCVLFMVLHPDCGPVQARMFPASRTERKFMVSVLPKDKWCFFVDALGHPMAGATVEVIPSATWSSGQLRMESWSSITLDEAGRLRPPRTYTTLRECCFLVHDPNYGMGIVEPWSGVYVREELLSLCVVPLAAVGTRADERSIWGKVVDANDEPIPAAVIQCRKVAIPGGGTLDAWWPWRATWDKPAKVLTDARGDFAMHLPLATEEGNLGRPVPPGAEYQVTIEAPAELDFYPYHGNLAAGEEHTVVLERKGARAVSYAGSLVFADEHGTVTDPEMLQEVALTIRFRSPQGNFITVGYKGEWMDKKELPFGTYSASANWDGKTYLYGPIEVTPESPDTLVFEPVEIQPGLRLYRGRVVHGVTGAPIPQATVMRHPMLAIGLRFHLEPKYKKQFMDFGPETDPQSEFFQALRSQGLSVAQTDSQGRFEIALPGDAANLDLEMLIAIKKDFLGAEQGLLWHEKDSTGALTLHGSEPDDNGAILLPEMKLFPAATIVIEPNVPRPRLTSSSKNVRFFYDTREGDRTPWLKDLWAVRPENRGGCTFRKHKVPSNEQSLVYVPADVELTLKVLRSDTSFAPAVFTGVLLRQGQVLELGRVDFPAAMEVVVRVIDSAGKPLEGMSVRRMNSHGHYWGEQGVTDSEGLTHLNVPPHSDGIFAVEYFDQEAMVPVRQSTPYAVAGPEDAGREFVLRLSDAFLEQLLK